MSALIYTPFYLFIPLPTFILSLSRLLLAREKKKTVVEGYRFRFQSKSALMSRGKKLSHTEFHVIIIIREVIQG